MMSKLEEEKRLLDEVLTAVSASFEEYGLLETVLDLCKSEEVLSGIDKGWDKLMSNIKNVSTNAPESIRSEAIEMANFIVNNNKEAFAADAIANLKIRLHFKVKFVLDIGSDETMRSILIEGIKKGISIIVSEEIKDICESMVDKHSVSFRNAVYELFQKDFHQKASRFD